MANFYTGTATINSKLIIAKADKGFYQFIDWENPIFLEQSVCKEDFPKLKAELEAALATGERGLATYRVLRPDGSLHWVIADITRETFDGQEQFLTLNIQAVDSLERELCAKSDEIRELSTYLDIMDELFFKYHIEKDEFCLFMGGERQQVSLFKGSLEEWEQSILDKHALTEKYEEAFENFCEDLRQGTRHFSREIMMPHLVRGDAKELYLMRGKTIADSAGESLVLGCVYTMAKNTYRRKSRPGPDVGRDEMTGLLSKQTIKDYVKNVISAGSEGTCYLCVMDIDNFKYVNDNFGHMFGDEVLMTVADILKEAVGEQGVAGRIGGDEMLLFLENIKDRVDLKSILRTVRTNVEWAYKGIRDDLHLSCSIGAAAWPTDADNYDDLFKIADRMLYRAKAGGKNRYIIYTADIHGNVLAEDSKEAVPAVARRNPLKGSKEQLLLGLTENFLHRGLWSLQYVLEETGTAFNLAEVNVFYDEPVYTTMHWRADGRALAEKSIGFADTMQFRQLFNETNLAVVDHTADLEFACPGAYAGLNGQHVTAALFYRMDGAIPGYVAFYKEDMSSRLWTESDKVYLNLIGKMIELVICGR